MIRFIYGFIPVLIIFSDKLMPKRFTAYCYGFIVVVRPSHKDDNEIIEHELVHSRQILKSLFTYPLWYHLCRSCRLKYEVEAYMVQIEAATETIEDVVKFLYYEYDLDMTEIEILKEIERQM